VALNIAPIPLIGKQFRKLLHAAGKTDARAGVFFRGDSASMFIHPLEKICVARAIECT
jgi:hypothetical protein